MDEEDGHVEKSNHTLPFSLFYQKNYIEILLLGESPLVHLILLTFYVLTHPKIIFFYSNYMVITVHRCLDCLTSSCSSSVWSST